MTTVKTVMTQLTDAKVIMQEVKDTLRKIDPQFPEEEAKLSRAAAELVRIIGDSTTPSASEYLAAMEQESVSNLIYVGWLGFQFNLDCFHNPVNTLLLSQDYEDLHRENRMHTLPMAQKARNTVEAFYKAVPAEKRGLTSGITGFYAYLQTVGYKLAHYFGFLLADRFYYYVIPGYTSDSLMTARYTRELQDYLHMDIRCLEERQRPLIGT